MLCQLSYWPVFLVPRPGSALSARRGAAGPHGRSGPTIRAPYFDSRCTVCVRHHRQYFLNSSRPVVFRLFLVVL